MLRPWLGVSTWHTRHPLDGRRFHQALKTIFAALGTQIFYEDFVEAMDQLSADFYPEMQEDLRNELIEAFAMRAADIADYLRDARGK